jgi:hypothetical protein
VDAATVADEQVLGLAIGGAPASRCTNGTGPAPNQVTLKATFYNSTDEPGT